MTYPEDDADRFRSDLLVRCTTTPLPVEAMAGLRVRTTEGWRPVAFASRSPVDWKGGTLFVPEPREHAAVCRLFGRPKDLRRAALLDAIGAPA